MLGVVVAVGAAAAIASFVVHPSKARAFDLYYGTTILNDNTAPVVVDLASGKPTVRMSDSPATVGAAQLADLDIVGLDGGSLLLDTVSGEFNMVDSTGFVVKSTGGGVQLPALAGSTGATGVAVGNSAYILQTAPTQTEVYLVSQSTVAAASTGTSTPRAHGSIPAPTIPAPGSAVAANGDLWMLTGSGARTLRRLHVPSGSDNGVQLGAATLGSVPAVSALAVTPANAAAGDSSGQDVAVASSTGVVLYDSTGHSRQAGVSVPPGTDRILPAGNDKPTASRFDFLYHSPAGWTLVSATPDGAGSTHPVTGIDASADLTTPAQSQGAVYTMSTTSGALWRIDGSGIAAPVEGMPTYPVRTGETPDLTKTAVEAFGSRVIVNNRSAYQAVTIFADGSQLPVTIDKSTAIVLSSSGGIEALTAQHPPAQPDTNKPVPNPAQPEPKPAEQVNDKIDCTTTSQDPHAPVVQLVQRASRSIQLSWQYETLSNQDCFPSTYTVKATVLDSGAPKAPGEVRVDGQDGVNLAGLFPNTKYRIVVTAWINAVGTESKPIRVLTSPEGPPAPTRVTTHADDNGNWVMSWNSCGGLSANCVPTTSWRIIPAYCDGLSLSSPPPAVTIAGDQTLHTFSYTYPGNAGMLGRGVSFDVEGIGPTGLISESTNDAGCETSWAHPLPANVTVNASTPAHTSGQASSATSTTTVGVAFNGDEDVALGGIGGQLGYTLLSGGQTIDAKGPTDATTVAFAGLRPGQKYQVQVTLYPPDHPEAAVSLAPVDVDAAISDWPTLTLSPAPSFAATDYRTGALSVTIAGVSSADARGETFDLTNSSLTCGNTSKNLVKSNVDPSNGALTFNNIDRATYNGSCTVTVQLQQDTSTETSPPVYGAGSSNTVTAPITLPTPDLATTASDFKASWSTTSDGSNAVSVSYTGSNALLLSKSTDWSVTVLGNGSTDCGTVTDNAPPVQVPVTGACIENNDAFTASVNFTYYGSPQNFSVPVSGNATRLDLAASDFTATWAADASYVTISTTRDLSGGTNWDLVVGYDVTPNCGEVQVMPSAAGTDIPVDPACVLAGQNATTWQIVVKYQ
ncbi:MAG TPA: hypothetical protein VGL26_01310, partial [Jatrophihabitans sp.]